MGTAYAFGVRPAHAPRVVCSVPSLRLRAVMEVMLKDGRARIPKSRLGRPKVAHGFNRGLRVENGRSPGGAIEKMGLGRRVLSSLTGLVSYSRYNPAINRWAILERPCGTWNRDTQIVLYRSKDGQMSRVFTNRSQLVGLRRSFVVQIRDRSSPPK